MPQIFVRVDGALEAQRDFTDLPPRNRANLKENTLRSAHMIGAEFLAYPAPPPMSKYIRTGRLAESVKVIDTGDNGHAVSIDPVSDRGVHYGRYVIGYADGTGQAQVHVGRWKLLKVVADQEERNLYQRVEAQLNADIAHMRYS